MKIQLLNASSEAITGSHLSLAAWNNSRPRDNETDLGKILGIDVPVNEMATAVLNIESTIIEREIIASMRDHVMWARSSRVEAAHEWSIHPKIFKLAPTRFISARNTMLKQKAAGVRQDEYRLLTPVCSNTHYTIRISLRSLVHLYLCFEELSISSSPIAEVFLNSLSGLYSIIAKLSPIPDLSIARTKAYNFLPKIVRFGNGAVGDMVTITRMVPFSLRTHIVRHRPFVISDGIYELICSEDILCANLTTPISIQVSANTGFWKQITSKRSCWMAQYDLWKEILDQVEDHASFGINALPCSDGVCPYKKDAELRGSDEYPGTQCPRYLLLEGETASEKTMHEMQKQVKDEKRPEFWNNVIEELK